MANHSEASARLMSGSRQAGQRVPRGSNFPWQARHAWVGEPRAGSDGGGCPTMAGREARPSAGGAMKFFLPNILCQRLIMSLPLTPPHLDVKDSDSSSSGLPPPHGSGELG